MRRLAAPAPTDGKRWWVISAPAGAPRTVRRVVNADDRPVLRPFDRATYLIYVDDSGDETDSFHTGIFVPVQQWSTYLARWLTYRKRLYTKHKVPSRWELHSSSWLMGKDMPVPGDPNNLINTAKGLRHEWSQTALRTIAGHD